MNKNADTSFSSRHAFFDTETLMSFFYNDIIPIDIKNLVIKMLNKLLDEGFENNEISLKFLASLGILIDDRNAVSKKDDKK